MAKTRINVRVRPELWEAVQAAVERGKIRDATAAVERGLELALGEVRMRVRVPSAEKPPSNGKAERPHRTVTPRSAAKRGVRPIPKPAGGKRGR